MQKSKMYKEKELNKVYNTKAVKGIYICNSSPFTPKGGMVLSSLQCKVIYLVQDYLSLLLGYQVVAKLFKKAHLIHPINPIHPIHLIHLIHSSNKKVHKIVLVVFWKETNNFTLATTAIQKIFTKWEVVSCWGHFSAESLQQRYGKL